MVGDKLMCNICGFTHCLTICPNYNANIISHCSNCNSKIYDIDVFWKDNDDNDFCSEKCAEEYYGIKEIDG